MACLGPCGDGAGKGSRRESSRAAIATVARALGDERRRVVFVGGTVVALYPLEGAYASHAFVHFTPGGSPRLSRIKRARSSSRRISGFINFPLREKKMPSVQKPSRPCPRCHCGLFEGRAGDARLLGCGRCGGVWLPAIAWVAVLRGAAQGYVALAEQAAHHAQAQVSEGLARCPVCDEPLVRTQARPSTVFVDVCSDHGTWFDANELRIVALAHAKFPPPITFNPADYLPKDADDNWNDGRSSIDLGALVGFVDAVVGDSSTSSDASTGSCGTTSDDVGSGTCGGGADS
jgi:Zn-finger nucleic acid-binding protein